MCSFVQNLFGGIKFSRPHIGCNKNYPSTNRKMWIFFFVFSAFTQLDCVIISIAQRCSWSRSVLKYVYTTIIHEEIAFFTYSGATSSSRYNYTKCLVQKVFLKKVRRKICMKCIRDRCISCAVLCKTNRKK